uniref:Uncharacterized protein n=1 Tax=Methylophaga nitratireducenticrescens TaxID=754476 RepID=I1XM44_METNJ
MAEYDYSSHAHLVPHLLMQKINRKSFTVNSIHPIDPE